MLEGRERGGRGKKERLKETLMYKESLLGY